VSTERSSGWFSLMNQPQQTPSPDAPTLSGEELEAWKARFAPLLRYLRRRRVVLALSGGGLAMPCHVSVLRVLELLGIPVAAVYGTSAGAVVGGLYAAGASVADLERIMLDIKSPDDLFGFASRHPAVRLAAGEVIRAFTPASLERAGIYDSSRLENYLRSVMERHVGRVPSLSECTLPFTCVAFDIGTGTPAVGGEDKVSKRTLSASTDPDVSLADAVAASMSIPGTLPPKRIGRRYHIDGATVEHLPVVTAFDDWRGTPWRKRRRTAVVAVDLGYGGRAPRVESLRHPMDLILYSNSIQSRAITDYSLVHCHRPRRGFSVILLRPRTFSVGLCDVEKIPDLLRTSYTEAVNQLSGDDFLERTREHIRCAGAFLGLGDFGR
jgi:predicted acylesterase/phospholipase RssA